MKAFFVVTFLTCLSLAPSITSSAASSTPAAASSNAPESSLKPIPTSAISGLKCYYCIGDADCCSKKTLEQNQDITLHPCLDGMCMRTWVSKADRVVSGCITPKECDALSKYKCDNNQDKDECNVSCCKTDGCNTGSSSVPISSSTFLVTMCSVLALVLLK